MSSSNKKENKSTIGVIIFVVFLIVMSLAFTVFFTISGQSEIIELPRVNYSIMNKENTESANVSAVFSIKTNDKKLSSTNKDVINSDLIEAMEDIDFEELQKDDATEYVKSVVKEKLSQKYGSSIEDIYISDFINDVKIPSKNDQDNKNENNVSKTMEGLFKGMN